MMVTVRRRFGFSYFWVRCLHIFASFFSHQCICWFLHSSCYFDACIALFIWSYSIVPLAFFSNLYIISVYCSPLFPIQSSLDQSLPTNLQPETSVIPDLWLYLPCLKARACPSRGNRNTGAPGNICGSRPRFYLVFSYAACLQQKSNPPVVLDYPREDLLLLQILL